MATNNTEDLYTRIKNTAIAFFESYSQEQAGKDIKALSCTLSPDCRRYFAPHTVLAQAPSLAAGLDNKQYEAQMQPELENVYAHWRVEILDLAIDDRAKKAVGTCLMTCTTHQGREYAFEFIFKLQMTENGDKIKEVVEFVDTAQVATFMSEQTEIAKQLQKTGSESA